MFGILFALLMLNGLLRAQNALLSVKTLMSMNRVRRSDFFVAGGVFYFRKTPFNAHIAPFLRHVHSMISLRLVLHNPRASVSVLIVDFIPSIISQLLRRLLSSPLKETRVTIAMYLL